MVQFAENGAFGYIDKRGKVVIAARFKDASEFSGGLAHVLDAKGRGHFIDRKGKIRFSAPPASAEASALYGANRFSDGLALVVAVAAAPQPTGK